MLNLRNQQVKINLRGNICENKGRSFCYSNKFVWQFDIGAVFRGVGKKVIMHRKTKQYKDGLQYLRKRGAGRY